MVICCTGLEERAVAEMAWRLAQREAPFDTAHRFMDDSYMSVLFSEHGADGTAENYRMQSFIREWAALGHVPAQSLLAKAAAKRLGV